MLYDLYNLFFFSTGANNAIHPKLSQTCPYFCSVLCMLSDFASFLTSKFIVDILEDSSQPLSLSAVLLSECVCLFLLLEFVFHNTKLLMLYHSFFSKRCIQSEYTLYRAHPTFYFKLFFVSYEPRRD